MVIMDGKEVSEQILQELKGFIQDSHKKYGLTIVSVGDDYASGKYIKNKESAAAKVGIKTHLSKLPSGISQQALEDVLGAAAKDEETNGIILQLPIPKHLDVSKALSKIPPHKDVDGFACENMGALVSGVSEDLILTPCTAAGVIKLLEYYQIPLKGKHAVVVGRSNIVGKPVASMLLNRDCTVTICHSKTVNLSEITKQADILIAAVGSPKIITKDMVKPGAVVIDVGINRGSDGKLCGDVDYNNVKDIASYITPVPGGVGPMTVAMLMCNTYKARNLNKGDI